MGSSACVTTGVRVSLDFLLLFVVATPFFVFKFGSISPTQRGFFCDDDSINYPYHPSTISGTALILVSVLLNVFFFFVCEIANYQVSINSNPQPAEKICNLSINRCLYAIMGLGWGYTYGLFATISLTNLGKYTIGRLRPHFLDGCKISPNVTTLCSSSDGGYITNFTCLQEDAYIADDLWLSFPSGHASISAFSMVFLAYYIQQRMPRLSVTYLLKTTLQLIVIGFAWYCALSRVMDYKHHPTDVLAGSVLGTVLALLFARYVMKSFRDPYNNGHFRRRGFGAAESLELDIRPKGIGSA